jgi:uncharacterized protein (DUF697 family)
MSIIQVGRDVLDAARELDFNGIEREVTHPIRVLIAGRDDASNRELAKSAFGPPDYLTANGSVEIMTLKTGERPIISPGLDLGVLVVPPGSAPDPLDHMLIASLRAYAVPTVVILARTSSESLTGSMPSPWLPDIPEKRIIRSTLSRPDEVVQQLRAILRTLDRHKLAPLAYRFEPLRTCLVEELVRDSSRVNGQFALFSSLPSLVPVVGGLVSSVADLFILTKNQVTLVFRIAGIYGRDLSDRTAVLLEIAPVVGGAFLWRSVARSLVALLPGALGAVPKTLVAYVGTYVVGQIAHYYYREGRRPSPVVLDEIRREGLTLARKVFHRD